MKKLAAQLDHVRLVRVLLLMCGDAVLINLAALVALYARLDFDWSLLVDSGFLDTYLRITAWYTPLTIVVFAVFHLYRSLWAYASLEELLNILVAVVVASAACLCVCVTSMQMLPRSFPFLNSLFLFVFITGFRYSYRMFRRFRRQGRQKRRRTMLVGGGSAGAMVLRELQTSARSENQVVCIVDDDPAKLRSYLRGVRVAGNREQIPALVEQYRVEDIILALPTAEAADKRAIIEQCQKTRCRVRTLPALYQLANGQATVQQLRNVEVEDLLGRDKVRVELGEIQDYVRGKVILVTGGGGSIGSELCRQLAEKEPKQLIIFDIYENNAYDIQQELRQRHPELNLVTLIGSVRDEERVRMVFEKYHPQLVCHAAAHKHVPLMEENPNEAIKNNVMGTWHVARAADTYGAEAFILISSDKAVNPTNVMGASKRICEMIVQVMGKKSATRFAAVRFGNVLGSNGSVIPLFRKQIEHGGPVTVTHRDIIRYFMTISEAVSLVLQAWVYARGGEVFVLDMGEPVRIDDLARNMIRLSGLEPDVDIPIVYTGLRPGEKLYEELLMQDEGLDKTPNNLIFIGHFNDFDETRLEQSLELLNRASQHNSEQIRDLIESLVKTYHPAAPVS